MTEDWYRSRWGDEDCDCYGKELVYIPTDNGAYRLICPVTILTQSDYNLKYIDYKSKAQMEEEDG